MVPLTQAQRVSDADVPAEQLAADDLAGGQDGNDEMPGRRTGDDFGSPKSRERFERRQLALQQRIAGKGGKGKVHQVAKGQFVELALEKSDRVFVILVDNGDQVAASATIPNYNGPLHNAIAEPDRNFDNNTIWQSDFNSDHYRDMYFNRMVDYYAKQSSGRYTINGSVTEWVKVPFNGARYGSNTIGDTGAWTLIADAINTWTAQQLASGKTLQQVTDYLKTFDQWDRYDYDGDGNFDEPDGYIDHFQIVHSGAGEETGGGAQGANAIWSHRWQAWYNFAGFSGPSYNRDGGVEFGGGWGANPNGGITSATGGVVQGINSASATAATVQNAHAATPTGIFVGDYTIQPENGGLGVFAHEFGHDLGLPDQYDTNSGDNGTGFWTIMSVGSYLGNGSTDIGSKPGDMYAWDKLQLGWLNYDVATAGKFSTHKLGPAETNTKKAQAVVIPLPEETNDLWVLDPVATRYGNYSWWGGKANLADNSMTRSLSVPSSPTPVYLTMRMKYAIESGWDYAYVSVSNDGGTTWTNLAGQYQSAATTYTALTTTANPNGQNLGNGITGTSAVNATFAPSGWRNARFDVTAYAGTNVQLRIRYKTDEFTLLNGILVDEIAVGGVAVDNAESGENGWTLAGFKQSTGREVEAAPHYYIAEYRQYRTYDEGLKTGPYVFGSNAPYGNWVEHFPYQDGLLVTYWDTAVANNNTSQHPGEGRSLPIDAHPEPLSRAGLQLGGSGWNFAPWGSRYQMFDATFGLEDTDVLRIPFRGTLPGAINDPACLPSGVNSVCQFWTEYPAQPGNPVFDDSKPYWFTGTAASSVIVPNTATKIRVVNTSAQGTMMQIHVN